jgi:hypothetical protein
MIFAGYLIRYSRLLEWTKARASNMLVCWQIICHATIPFGHVLLFAMRELNRRDDHLLYFKFIIVNYIYSLQMLTWVIRRWGRWTSNLWEGETQCLKLRKPFPTPGLWVLIARRREKLSGRGALAWALLLFITHPYSFRFRFLHNNNSTQSPSLVDTSTDFEPRLAPTHCSCKIHIFGCLSSSLTNIQSFKLQHIVNLGKSSIPLCELVFFLHTYPPFHLLHISLRLDCFLAFHMAPPTQFYLLLVLKLDFTLVKVCHCASMAIW